MRDRTVFLRQDSPVSHFSAELNNNFTGIGKGTEMTVTPSPCHLGEQGFDKLFGLERLQIVNLLTHTDELDGNIQF